MCGWSSASINYEACIPHAFLSWLNLKGANSNQRVWRQTAELTSGHKRWTVVGGG